MGTESKVLCGISVKSSRTHLDVGFRKNSAMDAEVRDTRREMRTDGTRL